MAKETGISGADEHLEKVVMKPAGVITKAAKSKAGKTLGAWLFVIGFLVAVIAGLVNALAAVGLLGMSIDAGLAAGAMALIGLIVGLVNVSDKEAINFLIGAIAIGSAAAAMTPLANLGAGTAVAGATSFVAIFIGNLAIVMGSFIGPAALVVGLKVVYSSARKA